MHIKKHITLTDDYRHKGLRKKLEETLRAKGIRDEKILQAIGTLPRHQFLDTAFEEQAYEDRPFPIGAGQTISQPYTVAYQSTLLEVKKRDKILEIGTGSGYQAAILSLLGARVFTIERQESLFHKTNHLLQQLGFGNIRSFLKDGFKGLPEFAPFDKILITAAPEEVPLELVKQLKPGGLMVFPKGATGRQVMCLLIPDKQGNYLIKEMDFFSFVPMLPGISKNK